VTDHSTARAALYPYPWTKAHATISVPLAAGGIPPDVLRHEGKLYILDALEDRSDLLAYHEPRWLYDVPA
jgi:hypothetical protein